MTEKKDTLSLDANEWRSMIIHNLQRGVEFVNGNGQITPDGIVAFSLHLDRIKVLVGAWHAAAPPASPGQAQAPEAQPQVATQANGAVPKRRGGWPAGKPRKPQAPQVQ